MSLTRSEKIFIERAAHYVTTGCTFDEAVAQVLLDDKRIRSIIMENTDDAAAMRAALAAEIYFDIRKTDAINRALAPTDYAAEVRRLNNERPVLPAIIDNVTI